jgi:hypothetical protein
MNFYQHVQILVFNYSELATLKLRHTLNKKKYNQLCLFAFLVIVMLINIHQLTGSNVKKTKSSLELTDQVEEVDPRLLELMAKNTVNQANIDGDMKETNQVDRGTQGTSSSKMPSKEIQTPRSSTVSKSENIPENNKKVVDINKDETLLRELMTKNKVGQANIISIANNGFRHFTLNWIMSLKRNGYDKFLVFCFDKPLVRFLGDQGYKENAILIPRNWLDYDLSEEAINCGEKEFNQMTQSKVNVWYHLLMRNFTILFSDPDIVWLSPHILAHIEYNVGHSFAEITFSQDQMDNVLYFNTGFIYAKPTKFVTSLLKNLREEQLANTTKMQQFVLHDMLMKNGFDDKRIETLDPILYASGYIFFDLFNGTGGMGFRPLIVHANYMLGKDTKIQKLKQHNFWYLNSTEEAA